MDRPCPDRPAHPAARQPACARTSTSTGTSGDMRAASTARCGAPSWQSSAPCCANWTSWSPPSLIQAPVLLLADPQDHQVPIDTGRRLARALPDARLQLVAGAGHHLPRLEAPVKPGRGGPGFGRRPSALPHYHRLKPKTPPNAADDETADPGTTHLRRSCQWGRTGGPVMIGWLLRSREPGARLVRNPARPAGPDRPGGHWRGCGGGDGAWLLAGPPGIGRADRRGRSSRGGVAGGQRSSGPVSPGTRSTRPSPGSGLSRFAGSAGGRRSIWPRFWSSGRCPSITARP